MKFIRHAAQQPGAQCSTAPSATAGKYTRSPKVAQQDRGRAPPVATCFRHAGRAR